MKYLLKTQRSDWRDSRHCRDQHHNGGGCPSTQLPDYHYAGTDIYIKYKRASINPFEPYFPIEAELHVINHPINSVEGRVVKNRFVVPPAGYNGRRCTLSYNECPRDHFVFSTAKTTWNRDNTFSNGESYQRYCQRWGMAGPESTTKHVDYHHDAIYRGQNPPLDSPPVAYLDGKQASVGNVVVQGFFSLYKEVWTHVTFLYFVAKHTSGTKTFNVRIEYRVEGDSRTTTVPLQFSLEAGGNYQHVLYVPGGGGWADVVSVDISDTMPLPDPSSDSGKAKASESILARLKLRFPLMESLSIKRMHQIEIKTKTTKRERYSEMRTFIVSMSLFVVVATYIALHSPATKTMTAKAAATRVCSR